MARWNNGAWAQTGVEWASSEWQTGTHRIVHPFRYYYYYVADTSCNCVCRNRSKCLDCDCDRDIQQMGE